MIAWQRYVANVRQFKKYAKSILRRFKGEPKFRVKSTGEDRDN